MGVRILKDLDMDRYLHTFDPNSDGKGQSRDKESVLLGGIRC